MILYIIRRCLLIFAFVLAPIPITGQHKNMEFPPELIRFKALGNEPIFSAAPGQWDAKIRERGSILKDGETWKLWYTGYADPQGTRLLGYATSKDGLSWTRHPSQYQAFR